MRPALQALRPLLAAWSCEWWVLVPLCGGRGVRWRRAVGSAAGGCGGAADEAGQSVGTCSQLRGGPSPASAARWRATPRHATADGAAPRRKWTRSWPRSRAAQAAARSAPAPQGRQPHSRPRQQCGLAADARRWSRPGRGVGGVYGLNKHSRGVKETAHNLRFIRNLLFALFHSVSELVANFSLN